MNLRRLRWRVLRLRELASAAGQCRGEAIWLAGRERHSGEPLTAFYYGTLDRYDYLVKRLFAEHTITDIEEGVWVWSGLRWLESACADCDLVVGDLSWPYCRHLPHTQYLHAPSVVMHKVRLARTWAAMEQMYRARRANRDHLNKVEKAGLSFRTTNDCAAVERFYTTMYVPYATRRHGEMVQVETLQSVMRVVGRGALIEVLHAGSVVGAGVLYPVARSMRFLWLGMLEGLRRDVLEAVGAGLYYFSMQYAIEHGCDELNLMYCAPVLNDGIYRYKRKLVTEVHNNWGLGEMHFRARVLTPAVRSFFVHTPLAVADAEGTLTGRVLVNEPELTARHLKDLCKEYACAGLRRLDIFSIHPVDPALPADDCEVTPVRVHDLSRLADPAAAFCRT